jgi:hypothetical protein
MTPFQFAAILVRALSVLIGAASVHFFLGAFAVRGMYESVIDRAKQIASSAPVQVMAAEMEIASIRTVHIYILTGFLLLLVSATIWLLSKPLGRLLCLGLVPRDTGGKNA